MTSSFDMWCDFWSPFFGNKACGTFVDGTVIQRRELIAGVNVRARLDMMLQCILLLWSVAWLTNNLSDDLRSPTATWTSDFIYFSFLVKRYSLKMNSKEDSLSSLVRSHRTTHIDVSSTHWLANAILLALHGLLGMFLKLTQTLSTTKYAGRKQSASLANWGWLWHKYCM